MAEIIQNTVYILSQGAYLAKDGETVAVSVDREIKARLPMHLIQSVVTFGDVGMSPHLMHALAERGISTTYLGMTGRLLARVDAPGSGNVLLRRAHFRKADCELNTREIARSIVTGKIQNSRTFLLRASRDLVEGTSEYSDLRSVSNDLEAVLFALEKASTVDEIRGHEGRAAERYFSIFSHLIKQQRDDVIFLTRNRRPPLDAVNALLSFTYSLLLNDCVAALTSVGLDPSVGFLHTDRPGRPSLALDLMEEFRAIVADRLVIKLINRKEVSIKGFKKREGGAIEMDDDTRKRIIDAYQERKKEKILHPLTEEQIHFGLFPFVQARILARHIREDIPSYLPYLAK